MVAFGNLRQTCAIHALDTSGIAFCMAVVHKQARSSKPWVAFSTMAKKNNDTKELFKSAVPKMPEGYSSEDKPNPNLRAFVEQHLREKPFDPAKHNYDVPAFNKPIETTKATAIYNMHSYSSKKPHDAIRQFIRHFTEPGDLILDPFSGSGGTALAALLEERKAVAIDRSPAATFITKHYCTPIDVAKLRMDFSSVKESVQKEIASLYETRCHITDRPAQLAFTVFSQVFQCPRCLGKGCPIRLRRSGGHNCKGKIQKDQHLSQVPQEGLR